MEDIRGTLPEVLKTYKNYNLLVPTATDTQLNPFYKFHVEEVAVDLSDTTGDIFKVGSVRTKAGFVDTFSLSKPLLNKMAMAAGIQFNPEQTYGERIDRTTYRAQAQGAMRKADGTSRTETDQKVICLEDEEEKYKIEYMDKAVKGITDYRQANAAAEIFKGKWTEAKDKTGKMVKAYLIDESDRDRYIQRSIMVNMALLKKTWAEKAMTGAKLRVIRALLGVKGTYTKDELQKNFAIPTVVFSPDYTDPQIRQAMLSQGVNSVNNMFGGTPAIPVKAVNFDTPEFDIEADLQNPAFISDQDGDAIDALANEPANEPVNKPANEPANEPVNEPVNDDYGNAYRCVVCGTPISEKVYNFSNQKFGEPLCINCQRGAGR